VQWEGLKRIECLLDVILTSGDQAGMQAGNWIIFNTLLVIIFQTRFPGLRCCGA